MIVYRSEERRVGKVCGPHTWDIYFLAYSIPKKWEKSYISLQKGMDGETLHRISRNGIGAQRLFRQLENLTGINGVALHPVQFHNFRIPASGTQTGFGDIP